jgi:predicted nucleic acid-binding protein
MLTGGIVLDSEECAVSSLTAYELGNVLWKESQKKKLKDPARVAEIFYEAIRGLQKIEIDSISGVLAIAMGRNLTFYDASYAYLAERENLLLVTQDEDLLKKCKAAITVKDI